MPAVPPEAAVRQAVQAEIAASSLSTGSVATLAGVSQPALISY